MEYIINKIINAREVVGCSNSKAWFRGQRDSSWKLKPSLFRDDMPDSNRDGWISGRSNELEQLIDTEKKRVSQPLLTRMKKTRKRLRVLKASLKDERTESVLDEIQKYEDIERELSSRIDDSDNSIEHLKKKHAVVSALQYGERDAFNEFSLRRGYLSNDSWATLAEMQHYGVRTRLLDWSESLNIALFFALKDYHDLYTSVSRHPSMKKSSSLEILEYINNLSECTERKESLSGVSCNCVYCTREKLSEPCIWVLNPFRLAGLSESYTTREYPCLSSEDKGYHSAFLENLDWAYKYPYPLRVPWSEERIKNQKGYFTVWGLTIDSLEEINDKNPKNTVFLKQIHLSKKESLKLTQELHELFSPDLFDIYLSVDHLGRKVNSEVFSLTST